MIKWIASLIRVLIQGSVKLLSCAILIPSLYKLLGVSEQEWLQHLAGSRCSTLARWGQLGIAGVSDSVADVEGL